ncbi:4-hydroxyphenylacetate 3-monooxygenase, oxygenase component [Bacillus lacus]|uniref:4-hydroxyphenylacetate 3-monooxygenase, oxygenase component n=1 Tax=Metabacillus lacus TaxID=1983721 RepID=A0A7X2J1D9_9BACI|nr:4-hydroxyphenylacetate 3-monooxygenase, oxygenase component [Metabacillus lacus]MRX73560.1 4-hydroxyphenylacetate 3-monooxygenase, oxygenase component [Metabacillus lacus]
MPAISGQQYLNRMKNLQPDLWLQGRKIDSAVDHPAFKGVLRTKAALYDLQLSESNKCLMTYSSPLSGDSVGVSFLQPSSLEDLAIRRMQNTEWAKASAGMLGRSPDYMNTVLMSLSSAAGVLTEQNKDFSKNLTNLYERARENDLCFTHSFINPQTNRSSTYIETSSEPIAARIMKTTSDGLIIKGARLLATGGGTTDEILVFPSGGKGTLDEYAFAFSLPSKTEGLRFICRESFHLGNSAVNYPLSSRFDEMDTVLVFDHVLVPWDRVLFYHRADLAQRLFSESSFTQQALHQVINRQIVKLEFLLGTAQLLVDSLNISEYQHVQEKISEIIIGTESLKGLLLKAEMEAKQDKWGIMVPEIHSLYAATCLYPKLYPQYAEILQLLGAGGLMLLSSEEDFTSPISGDIHQYLQGAEADAWTKTKIYRLVWDMTMSQFGTRQTQYERFFFGDAVRLKSNLYHHYPRKELVQEAAQFLNIDLKDEEKS